MRKPRVLLADDHAAVRAAVSRFLVDGFDVVAAARDGISLVVLARRLVPDVIVTDITMEGLNGFEAVRELRKTHLDTPIVFHTIHSEPAYVREAARLGALGYVLKASGASELDIALVDVCAGRSYLSVRLREQDGGVWG